MSQIRNPSIGRTQNEIAAIGRLRAHQNTYASAPRDVVWVPEWLDGKPKCTRCLNGFPKCWYRQKHIKISRHTYLFHRVNTSLLPCTPPATKPPSTCSSDLQQDTSCFRITYWEAIREFCTNPRARDNLDIPPQRRHPLSVHLTQPPFLKVSIIKIPSTHY